METSITDAIEKISLVCLPGEYISVMSILDGPNSILEGIFQYFSTKEARELRLVCKEINEAVEKAQWHDEETKIGLPLLPHNPENLIGRCLDRWRMCFPNATAANVSERPDLIDEDFIHFRNLKTLNISQIFSDSHLQGKFTDDGFKNLRGIQKLIMNYFNIPAITDEAFKNLRGIKQLIMFNCILPEITNETMINLRGIEELDMPICLRDCSEVTKSMLRGIKSLRIDFLKHPYLELMSQPSFSPYITLSDHMDPFWAIATNASGCTLLDLALTKDNTAPIVNRLIKLGANVNHTSEYYAMTPLQIACFYNKSGILESIIYLLDAGANINAEGNRRNDTTPLCYALRKGNTKLVELLLERGATKR